MKTFKGLAKKYLLLASIILVSQKLYSNTPPRIASDTMIYTRELDYYYYLIEAEDDEQDSLSITCIKKPDWTFFRQIGKKSASIEGMPLKTNYEGDTIIICVTDGELADTQVVVVVIDYVIGGAWFISEPDTIAYYNEEYHYSINVGGTNPPYIFIDCTQKPDWLSFKDNFLGNAELWGKPDIIDTGSKNTIIIYASYGSFLRKQKFELHVLLKNAINQTNKSSPVTICPNPVIDICEIKGLTGQFDLTLYNETGAVLQKLKSPAKINLSDYAVGLYFIKIDENKNSKIYPIIKK
jgi:hypothetical protein